jgi:hypothetical protein
MRTAQCTKANGLKGKFSLSPFMKLSLIFFFQNLFVMVCAGSSKDLVF